MWDYRDFTSDDYKRIMKFLTVYNTEVRFVAICNLFYVFLGFFDTQIKLFVVKIGS